MQNTTYPKGILSKNRDQNRAKQRVNFYPSESEESEVKAVIVGYVPSRTEISNSQSRTIWWNKHELEQLMLSARSMCRNKREDVQLGAYLTKAYEAIVDKSEKDEKEAMESHGTILIPDEENEKDFNVSDRYIKKAIYQIRKWMNQSPYRGLETWSCYEHETARENDQRDLTRAVLSAQRNHKLRYGRNGSKADKLIETLGDLSSKYSRHARLFAYAMGAADAAEAGIEIFPKKSNTLVKKVGAVISIFGRRRSSVVTNQPS